MILAWFETKVEPFPRSGLFTEQYLRLHTPIYFIFYLTNKTNIFMYSLCDPIRDVQIK